MTTSHSDDKPVSRQVLYKRRMKAEGKCIQCGRKMDKGGSTCSKCTAKRRIYQRKKFGHEPRQDGGVGRPVGT